MPRCEIVRLGCLFALLFLAAPQTAWSGETTTPSGDDEKYVCPPCRNPCDAEVFNAPGRCPGCGMTLVKKSEVRMMNVAIVLWNGVELLDFAGPGEVFAATQTEKAGFNVYTVGELDEPIVSQGFVEITPKYTIENCPRPDIIVLPGGGTGAALRAHALIKWVKDSEKDATAVMSVCTGAFILAEAGLLDGKEATTHWSAIDRLKEVAKNTKVFADRRFVDNGKIITCAGVSAGIDGSLHLVAKLLGDDVARHTARYMEYEWKPARAP